MNLPRASVRRPIFTTMVTLIVVVVGIVSLFWNAMGSVDYLMTETSNEAYMAKFTPEQLEYYNGFPAWAVSTWAIAVWGGLLGSVLLLLARRLATPVFLVSLIAMIITTIYSYGFTNGLEAMGGVGPAMFSLVIFVICVLLWLYARAMGRRGVLA